VRVVFSEGELEGKERWRRFGNCREGKVEGGGERLSVIWIWGSERVDY